jgi:iron(III) transport system substrate-binding protein
MVVLPQEVRVSTANRAARVSKRFISPTPICRHNSSGTQFFDGYCVPKGHPKIAHRFNGGLRSVLNLVPQGRQIRLLLPLFFLALIVCGCSQQNSVTIYTSQDQEYAEPIFNHFTKQTGIKVRPVYDNEAAKTVGLVNRLIAEKNNPQCDVFWNNEESRTVKLAAQGIIDERWPFGSRSRRLVYNTNLVHNPPLNLEALTNLVWRSKVAIAYPLFGTTSGHFLVLRQHWGDERWKEWCRALVANKTLVVDGNSVVVKMVAKGEAQIGITDSDDVAAGIREGLPISSVVLIEDGLIIPNTIGVVHGAPHLKNAELLMNFIRSQDVHVLESLGAFDSAFWADLAKHREINGKLALSRMPKSDWNVILRDENTSLEFLKGLFLR